MKTVLWPNLARAELLERLLAVPGIELVVTDKLDELVAALPEAQVLVIGSSAYGRDVAEAVRVYGRSLRFLQLLTAGYEGPLIHGVPPRVLVANAGESWSPAVAELAMTLLLALVKCVPAIAANHSKHGWERGFTARMGGLDEKTMAIIGYGSIGREVARRARAFGMRVIGVSHSARPDALADEVRPVSALIEVLGRADAIVLAVPFSPESERMIGAKELAACKPGAVLVNIARGGLIDQGALEAALKSGTIAGAGLDVTDPEPLPPDHPLWTSPNLLISPHCSGANGKTGRVRLARFIGENIERFIEGEPVAHRVLA
ncbi:MAG: D-2-hydroxyacid dehydrogenase [Burkholderiales bacterium]|nr:D-2-hydroxyacid dehydrogenase [Burkholderiales bacterium]